MSYLDELNPPQREAVLYQEGPLLIVAGAGAGKTKTITHRIFHLIKKGVSPDAILAVTFTNKAAEEMRERITSLMSKEGVRGAPHFLSETPFIGTFHRLGIEILRGHGMCIGVKKNFSVANKASALSLIKEAMGTVGYDTKQYDPKTILNSISRNKGDCVSPHEYLERSGGNFFALLVVRVWEAYETLLKKERSLDFDDLLIKAVSVLQKDKDARLHYQTRWRYLHIDEYQDTNQAQYILLGLLVGDNKNLCVVGDSDQNIYSWRGANIQNILRFDKDFPKARIIILSQNYRSTERILRAAQAIIQKNILRQDKKLFTKNALGEKLSLFTARSEVEEAFFVGSKVRDLLFSGVSPNEIALLYRANFQSRILEEVFLGLDIPYRVLGTRFFERKEVQDILAFVCAALNRESVSSLKRIINTPPRGIGKVTLLKLLGGQKKTLPQRTQEKVDDFFTLLDEIEERGNTQKPSLLIKWIPKRVGLDTALAKEGEEGKERLENIKELVTLSTKYDSLPLGEGIVQLLEDASLASEADSLSHKKEKGGGVSLMTVHASKGLEFPYVFIVGLEQGLFPHTGFDDNEGAQSERGEEERRLFYVALTRAGKRAFLSFSGSRTIYGKKELQSPSEFLNDIPEDLIKREEGVHDMEQGPFEEEIIT
ncbi:MAG: UvrD-helicase domain-containing protein [Candidatus Paceibacterota bacterium]